ncbi:MAG: gluconate permease [Phycisphaerae bacterium]|nr:gluconate permease [Phycisphaerae bacterium]
MHPLWILVLGIVIVIGMILFLRVNAFIAMITTAMIVSLLAPGEWSQKISRVATEFGSTAGKIGVVIAMAAIIGDCMTRSGAADRVVRAFMRMLGIKRGPVALMSSGFVLSIPVFFDTVFYLLIPLARSMHRQTKQRYLFIILAMGAGASITHSLVPPTPGPLFIAEKMGIDMGLMILMGLAISIPTAIIMYYFVKLYSPRFDIPMRPLEGSAPEPEPLADSQLPGLFISALPILLPVFLISGQTIVAGLGAKADATEGMKTLASIAALVGEKNLAMLVSAAVAIGVYWKQRRPSLDQMSSMVETSLMSAGIIILITSAGGAFGAMLQAANVGPAVQQLFSGSNSQTGTINGMSILLMGFLVAFLLKFAQGSSTVSMMTTAAMLAALLKDTGSIGFHPVYVAMAVGFGAQCGNWMNDSGFWVFAKMGGLTATETLKTWTVTVSLLAVVGLLVTIAFVCLLPWPVRM